MADLECAIAMGSNLQAMPSSLNTGPAQLSQSKQLQTTPWDAPAHVSLVAAPESGCELRPKAIASTASRLEAIASRSEAIASKLEAIAIRLKAIASRLEAIASKLEAIAIRLEAIIVRWRHC